jgi:hypothetical protein
VRRLTTRVELPPRASVTFAVPRGEHDVSIGVAPEGALMSLETMEGAVLETLTAPGKLMKLASGRYRLTCVGPKGETLITVWWRDAPHDWHEGDRLPM